MKKVSFTPPVTTGWRWSHEDENQLRTVWFADGRSVPARVTKVEKEGIQIATEESTEFINAADLCTADRVRYGFGTRKEGAWAARVTASEAKQKAAHLPHELIK